MDDNKHENHKATDAEVRELETHEKVEETKEKSNAFVSIIVGAFKAVFSLIIFTIKTFLSFFFALKTGAKVVFVVIVLVLIWLGYVIGYRSAEYDTKRRIEMEFGGDYDDLIRLYNQTKEVFQN